MLTDKINMKMDIKWIWTILIIAGSGSSFFLYGILKNKSQKIFSKIWLAHMTSHLLNHQSVRDKERNVTMNKLNTTSELFVMDSLPSPVKAESDKYIIYRCQGLCGGLADREKGIVTAYVVSQMLRRKFGIMMDKKCDFTQYVVPNLVNWVMTKKLLKSRSVGSKETLDTWSLGKAMRDGNLESLFNKEVMYYQGNLDFVDLLMNKTSFRSLLWTKNKTHHEIYRTAFGHLFKLAPNTEKKYTEIYKQISGKNLLCAHLRIGKSKTIPNDKVRAGKPNSATVIKFLQGKILKSSKYFVATDSEEIRVEMKNAFPSQFLEVAGPIVHIDRSGSSYDCSGMEKAILDQFILSRCDTLIMSFSGFSRISAILRGTDENLYIAVGHNVTITKRLNPTYHKLQSG